MKNNQLNLKIRAADDDMANFIVELFVDGMLLAPDAVVDLQVLAKSVQTSGRAWVFSCECGVPMCAGIDDPITVRQTIEAVEWHCKKLSSFGSGGNLIDEQFDRENTDELFRFDPGEYQRAVEDGLREARLKLAFTPEASVLSR